MTDRESANRILNAIDSKMEFIPLVEPRLRGVVMRALKRELETNPNDYNAEYLYSMIATVPTPALMYGFEIETVKKALIRLIGEENE